jgi:hypothetical protein
MKTLLNKIEAQDLAILAGLAIILTTAIKLIIANI